MRNGAGEGRSSRGIPTVEKQEVVDVAPSRAGPSRHGFGSGDVLQDGEIRIPERFQSAVVHIESLEAEFGEEREDPAGTTRMVTLFDLDQEPRPIAAEAFAPAFEDGELVTLDVDLDEPERGQVETVQRGDRNGPHRLVEAGIGIGFEGARVFTACPA